ncbi:hypothetical protein [Heliophilum fasciatum]|uniref:hypothetical protein n=1 Tax=Heliophilum fasciatum TaxID=35700 RepID=UPI0010437B17|nr:hypothetical protein [Heliophilum fasciatum]MCW2279043.1 hypothetical protein [Heliophilum fasciatum]
MQQDECSKSTKANASVGESGRISIGDREYLKKLDKSHQGRAVWRIMTSSAVFYHGKNKQRAGRRNEKNEMVRS